MEFPGLTGIPCRPSTVNRLFLRAVVQVSSRNSSNGEVLMGRPVSEGLIWKSLILRMTCPSTPNVEVAEILLSGILTELQTR